jgi:hypothetical protein
LPAISGLRKVKASFFDRALKNKHQAVSQGAWRIGKRSISADM